jgi:hypothetical protein
MEMTFVKRPTRRPMSAATSLSRMSNRTKQSNIPSISRMKLMTMANDIFRYKKQITDILRGNKISPRDKQTPSEILNVLKTANIYINLPHLKGLLREFGFNTTGVSCSFLDLIRRSEAIVNGGENPNYPKTFAEDLGPKSVKGEELDRRISDLNKLLTDIFYGSRRTLKEIFNVSKDEEDMLDNEGFTFIVKKYAPSFTDTEIQKLYKSVVPR